LLLHRAVDATIVVRIDIAVALLFLLVAVFTIWNKGNIRE